MVGVPGRSKGCHTCKRRRVKCDEQKPICARCSKGGFQCAGYAMPLEIRMSSLGSRKPPKGSTRSSPTCISVPQRTEERVPPSMSLDAFREPMYFAYLFDNFVWSSFASPWLQLSAEGKLGSLPFQACKALSQGTFGKYHAQPDIELHGAVSYGNAVSGIRLGLSRPKSEAAILLPSMLILLMYSNLTVSHNEAGNHIRGMLALLHTCGPEAFQSRELRPVLSSCRSTLIVVSMITRQRSFLEEESWRLLPWADGSRPKSDQDKLVDILAFLPGLLQQLEAVRQAPLNSVIEATHTFCSRVQSGLQALLSWRRVWDTEHPEVAFERPRINAGRGTYPSGAESLLCYKSFTCSVEHTLYNAMLICLLGLLDLVQTEEKARHYAEAAASASNTRQHYTHSPRAVLPLLAAGESWNMRQPAIEIVRAFDYQLLHVEQSRETALYWLFPVSLARKVLEDEPDWCDWIGELMDASQKSRGYGKLSAPTNFDYFPLSNRKTRVEGSAQGQGPESVVKGMFWAAAA